MKKTDRLANTFCAVTLAMALSLAVLGFSDPYVGTYNANNNYLLLAAKNFHRFGFAGLSFLPTYFAGRELPETVPYYLHHPPLLFWLSYLTYLLSGASDLTPRILQLALTLATGGALYLLVREIWDKKTANFTLLSYFTLPLTAVFWKVQFFEQITLFFTILSLIFIVRYLTRPKWWYLPALFLITLVNALADWYAGYLVFVLLFFVIKSGPKRLLPVSGVYFAGLLLGFGLFLSMVVSQSGGLAELSRAVAARGVAGELTSQPFWPVRYTLLVTLRLLLYATPFIIPAALVWWRQGLRDRLSRQIGAAFVILGFVNLVFLPTATWGHNYFLYYFIPAAATALGFWLSRQTSKPAVLVFALSALVVYSGTVSLLKDRQLKKQVWKYAFSGEIRSFLAPYETVTVVNYPGDLLENYWFHPTVPLSPAEYLEKREKVVTRVSVIACGAQECAEDVTARLNQPQAGYVTYPYFYGDNQGWVVVSEKESPGRVAPAVTTEKIGPEPPAFILPVYRQLRSVIGGIQI